MAASVTLWKLSVSGAWTYFVYDRSWIRPWIKSISNELDITFYVLAPQLSRRVPLCVRIVFFIASYRFIMLYKNRIIYVLLWRTIYVVTRVFWLYSFPPSLRNYWYTMKRLWCFLTMPFFIQCPQRDETGGQGHRFNGMQYNNKVMDICSNLNCACLKSGWDWLSEFCCYYMRVSGEIDTRHPCRFLSNISHIVRFVCIYIPARLKRQ